MTSRRQAPLPVRVLLLALMIAPPIAVLVSLPWLSEQADGLVFLLTGIAATVTVVASVLLSILHDRRLDEFERGNARFATQWGGVAGTALVAVLLALPPVRDAIVASVASVVGADVNQQAVLLAFTLGFAAVAIAQTVSTMALAIGWASWKLRAPRDLA
ncbi:hypothetical protein [Terricaulis sp.]|uniref:hypothetical protein n=1 Tax=Terricaulis sp. TaxID=2768686 RepID=UPI002AC713CB|nr:hypothetical protein [Terricaulis sp.]MDZ4690606.1 hypothetical protein [Terricaulis sp.]